jgi:hypothetical protein
LLKVEKRSWKDGRKLILLCDHNFPAVLPSEDELCPFIFRVEGGLLREIGTAYLNQLGDFTIPEGSVIIIGSLSHLMEEGRVGYTKGLVTEFICFSKAFNNTALPAAAHLWYQRSGTAEGDDRCLHVD